MAIISKKALSNIRIAAKPQTKEAQPNTSQSQSKATQSQRYQLNLNPAKENFAPELISQLKQEIANRPDTVSYKLTGAPEIIEQRLCVDELFKLATAIYALEKNDYSVLVNLVNAILKEAGIDYKVTHKSSIKVVSTCKHVKGEEHIRSMNLPIPPNKSQCPNRDSKRVIPDVGLVIDDGMIVIEIQTTQPAYLLDRIRFRGNAFHASTNVNNDTMCSLTRPLLVFKHHTIHTHSK